MTMEVNVTEDLNAVNDQLQKLVEELNRVSAARENLMQQVYQTWYLQDHEQNLQIYSKMTQEK